MRLAILALLTLATANATASDTYKIQVTRKGQDIYKVEAAGKDIYVKTRYCYEYSTWEDAILVLDSQPYSGSMYIGKLIFVSSGQTCDVDTVL